MKNWVFALIFIFICNESYSQSVSYFFNQSLDTAYETNGPVIAGYIKAQNPPAANDSVIVKLLSGNPIPTHIDTTSYYVIHFNAGQDSVAFILNIHRDTFPEYPEHITYVLNSFAGGTPVGNDSLLTFVLIDTTPKATISFIIDSTWCYEGNDSVVGGVYIPFGNICGVGITINNPNPFYIRFAANSIGSANNIGYPSVTAIEYADYFFNPQTVYAPPGISTYYKGAYLTNENSISDKYFICRIQNIDANIITDSLCFFTIKHVNYFDTPTLSFDTNSITIVGDSFQNIAIPITVSNPNRKPLYFRIDTTQSSSVYPGVNFTFNNQEYGYGNGISHDTFWVNFIKPYLTGDTISMVFVLRNDSVNASPDTLLSITAIDTGGGNLFVSFLGAGLSHLKSDSIGYVKVYNSSIAKFPISAKVSYLNGNAIRDTDFIFNDTTVTFTPYLYDTISLPVIMLQDHRRQGNMQVNLQLTNVNPTTVQYGITEYSYIIIDNEDSSLSTNVQPVLGNQCIAIYPNPAENITNIHTNLTKYSLAVTNTLGQEVYRQNEIKGNQSIDISTLEAGMYFFKVTANNAIYSIKVLKITR